VAEVEWFAGVPANAIGVRGERDPSTGVEMLPRSLRVGLNFCGKDGWTTGRVVVLRLWSRPRSTSAFNRSFAGGNAERGETIGEVGFDGGGDRAAEAAAAGPLMRKGAESPSARE
jgi:hypothetical protein